MRPHHEFGFDEKVLVPSEGDVLLHQAEVVEAADKKPTAIGPQVEVNLLTGVPVEEQNVAGSRRGQTRQQHT